MSTQLTVLSFYKYEDHRKDEFVRQEYVSYSLEELVEDRQFISFVLQGRNQKEWELFFKENPTFAFTANKARKIVELLHEHPESMDAKDIQKMWKNIDLFYEEIQTRTLKIKIRRIMRYAAIVVFTLLIGGSAGYWTLTQHRKSYVFTANLQQGLDAPSRLLLTNGTAVDLENKNSKIALSTDKQIIIDNDEVIDLSKTSSVEETKMNEVVIPFGKKSLLILADGTIVWLNAGSKFAFPTKFTGNKREVYLEGEAYFEVAQNKQAPFYVHTQELDVHVLGTKFNISAYPSDAKVETFLLEGKLAISEQYKLSFLDDETILAPSQKASYNKEEKTIDISDERDIQFAIAWTEGWFKFKQQNLDEVLQKLQRYYNVEFEYQVKSSKIDLITGKLDLKESIEKVMIALADVAKIQYQIDHDKIYIRKK